MRRPLPPGEHFAIVSRYHSRPDAEVYAWTLKSPLPVIRVPLRAPDPDLILDLPAVYEETFCRGRYERELPYDRQLAVPPARGSAGSCRRGMGSPTRPNHSRRVSRDGQQTRGRLGPERPLSRRRTRRATVFNRSNSLPNRTFSPSKPPENLPTLPQLCYKHLDTTPEHQRATRPAPPPTPVPPQPRMISRSA